MKNIKDTIDQMLGMALKCQKQQQEMLSSNKDVLAKEPDSKEKALLQGFYARFEEAQKTRDVNSMNGLLEELQQIKR